MKKRLTARRSLLLWLLLLVGAVPAALAQEDGPQLPNRTVGAFNCYPSTRERQRPAARPVNTGSNPNGFDITARGDLRVLIIYAGFTNDINPLANGYAGGAWPQEDPTHAPGTTFPVNAGGGFYTAASQFNSSATDQTLSNFYYQMSQFSTNPLRMYATIFPKRINVTADSATNRLRGFREYTRRVMEALKNDPDTQNFNFSQVDNRAGRPQFQFDNSAYATDNEVDYTIIVWRNAGTPYGTIKPPREGGGGWAEVPATSGIASANGQTYAISRGFTHTLGMEGVNPPLFVHEFAHTFYDCPHYLGANAVVGQHFYESEGPGMMGYFRTFFAANSWERWFNGWAELKTGPYGIPTDLQDASSLTADGVYTLRDYLTTGDMMRIRIPRPAGATHYLWLENHQGLSKFDSRFDFITDGRTPNQPFRTAPRGLVAFVETISGSRSQPLDSNVPNPVGVNGLKLLSAQGNYDYGHSATTMSYDCHFYCQQLYNFTQTAPNPFGGENQIARHRLDKNNDGEIVWDPTDGNGGGRENEMYYSIVRDGLFEDGFLGPDIAFGAGQKMGLATNSPIFEHQYYSDIIHSLSEILLNGLSVEVLSYNASTHEITIKVRYDDVDVTRDTRWAGSLVLPDVVPGSGADVHVSGATLTINKSGTPNRDTPGPTGDFINPTRFVCGASATFAQDAGALDRGSTVHVTDLNTQFIVNGAVQLGVRGTSFVVDNGALLDLTATGSFRLPASSQLTIAAGGTLVLRQGATVSGSGTIDVQHGAYVCLENGINWQTSSSFTLNVSFGATVGTNPALVIIPGVTCSSTIANYCGRLTGGNPGLTVSSRNCVGGVSQPQPQPARTAPAYTVTPNPATDQVTVQFEQGQAGAVQVSVQDMQGQPRLPARQFKLDAGPQALSLSIADLPAGLYLLIVEEEEGRHVTRLEVSR